MTMKALFLYISVSLIIVLSSCKGQVEFPDHKPSFSLGEEAQELPKSIWQIFQDSKGRYWFGSNGDGIFHYNGNELIRIGAKHGLLDNAIRGLQEDHLGNLYFETPKGVNKFDGKVLSKLPIQTSTNNKWQMDSLDLWFTCNASAHDVYRYDGNSLIELELPRQDLLTIYGYEVAGLGFRDMNNSPYAVFSIDRDNDGNIWFGTITGGAFRYDGTDFLWIGEKDLGILPDGRVPGLRSILEDKDGYIWLSHFMRKYKIEEGASETKFKSEKGFDLSNNYGLEDIPYFNSGVLYDGNLMVSTYGDGVWLFGEENLVPIPVESGSEKAYVVSMYKDKEGRIWLATDNGGAYYYNGAQFIKFLPLQTNH